MDDNDSLFPNEWGVGITWGSMKSFLNKEWLNDECINLVTHLINHIVCTPQDNSEVYRDGIFLPTSVNSYLQIEGQLPDKLLNSKDEDLNSSYLNYGTVLRWIT